MTRRTVGRKRAVSRHVSKPVVKHVNDLSAVIDAYLPAGSRERNLAKVAAAAGGALIAAAVLGVGPVALAGAAGYLVYRETRR
jgi:hypothetical protein